VELNVDERIACGVSIRRGHPVFEVKNHDICCSRCLLETLGAIRRAKQPCRTRILQTHQAGPSAASAERRRTNVLRVAVATTSPRSVSPVCANVTLPSPGRLFDRRFSVITVSAYRVSPWKSGFGNAISENPRLPTIVPCVSCATDKPTRVDSVNIEF